LGFISGFSGARKGVLDISHEKFNLDEDLGLGRAADSGMRKPLASGTQAKGAGRNDGPRRIDMVAIDLDGTLLSSDKRLSVKAIEAVTEVRRKGVKVVIASARPPRFFFYF